MPNKLIIFDLDGVLVDSRGIHEDTLNQALVQHGYTPISHAAHLSTYDGLPTKRKLELLAIPERDRESIWKAKQRATLQAIRQIRPDVGLQTLCSSLRNKGYKIAVASNAIHQTTDEILTALGIRQLVDDVRAADLWPAKPNPAMYWGCMGALEATAQTTVIVEDSHIGRQGALASGAILCPVANRSEVTLDRILSYFPSEGSVRVPYRNPQLNVVIPMAGEGSRFAAAGYTFPKPLIEVNGKPMIQLVVENLNIEANYIFLVRLKDYERYHLKPFLRTIAPNCRIIPLHVPTSGAACTVLHARDYINNERPLLIANSDQWLEWDANETMYAFAAEGIDGGIVTFEATHPKWSYVRLDEEGFVSEVAEKRVISKMATCGLYYWKRGTNFVRHAERAIARELCEANGEYYVAPVYNGAIAEGAKVRVKQAKKMLGLGDPESLNYFLEHHHD